jgi:hypothetical protein
MITVKRIVLVARETKGRVALVETPPAHEAAPPGRVPRISRLMALAIHFDRLLREGAVADISELARLAHVTQPRMTQIMNLNRLAPDIQEALLDLPPTTRGRDEINERMLRRVAKDQVWSSQRCMWHRLCEQSARGAKENTAGAIE